MSNYKLEQQKTREALKPRYIAGVASKRAARRRRVIDRTFTKKGFIYGRRLGGREDVAVERIAARQS